MHEMALTASILSLIKEEMEKAKAERLTAARIKYGALSNVVPESMEMAFEILVRDFPGMEGASLELVEELPVLACGKCGRNYTPSGKREVFMPCPACGNEIGNEVLSGKGVYLDQIEVDD